MVLVEWGYCEGIHHPRTSNPVRGNLLLGFEFPPNFTTRPGWWAGGKGFSRFKYWAGSACKVV